MKQRMLYLILGLTMMISCSSQNKADGPAKVEVKKNELGQYRLYVDNKEFYVSGAGCEGGNVAALAKCGGNSFRTWMDQEIRPTEISVLDDAEKNNVKVLMGISFGRERQGYDYNDTNWVSAQRDTIIAKVKKFKDHPGLLGWIIGNEINLGAENMKVYDAVNDVSKLIHAIDPNHPTTFTLSGIGKRDVDYIKEHCTDIDFLCIQMYGDIVNLQKRIADAGWEGPYLVTEWGATGHWEVAKTDWEAPIEQTSNEKAKSFIERYNIAIKADPINCMGSYVFLWGQKQERTPTWYGMFLEDGSKTETVDAMCYIWTGKYPEDRCPAVDSFRMEGKTAYENVKIKLRKPFNAEVFFTNFDNDTLTFKWEIIPESTDLSWGGDFESRPATSFHGLGNSKMELHAPDSVGPYRLFIYVTDKKGNAGTANIPFFVE